MRRGVGVGWAPRSLLWSCPSLAALPPEKPSLKLPRRSHENCLQPEATAALRTEQSHLSAFPDPLVSKLSCARLQVPSRCGLGGSGDLYAMGGEGTGWVRVWQPGMPIQCAKCPEAGHRQGDLEATPLKLCQCRLSSRDKKGPRGECPVRMVLCTEIHPQSLLRRGAAYTAQP